MCVCAGEDSEKKKIRREKRTSWGEKPSSLGRRRSTHGIFFFCGCWILGVDFWNQWEMGGVFVEKKMRFGDRERGIERERERET